MSDGMTLAAFSISPYFYEKYCVDWERRNALNLEVKHICTHCKRQVKVPSQYCLPFRAEKLYLRFAILYLNAHDKLTLVNPWKEDAYFL